MSAGPAAKRYEQLSRDRQPFLERAYSSAKLTIPSLLPREGRKSQRLYTPYQALGSRGVNNLASKLLISLFPPNTPFFRLVPSAQSMAEADQAGDDMRSRIEQSLSKYEREVMRVVERRGDRIAAYEALRHLLVAGNSLLHVEGDGTRVFHLDRYVVRRDPMGRPVEIITKETVSLETFDQFERFSKALRERLAHSTSRHDKNSSVERNLDVYTHLVLEDGMWNVYQEVRGLRIPQSEGTYSPEHSPYIPLRYTRIDGEDYGRGFVEEYYGDLRSLEALTAAITEGSAAAARVLFLLRPGATTKKRDLAKAANGAIVTGDADDVSTLQLEKAADFSVAERRIQALEMRLSFAFMLNSSVQRDAERVTAEEIRYIANELDDSLGGLHSILSQEFQLPYVASIMFLERNLPDLPKDLVSPVIVTGVEALGRGQDLRKLDAFLAGLADLFGPEAVAAETKIDEYMRRRGAALGIETEGLVKTPEEKQQEQQQALAMQALDTLGPEALRQIGGITQKGMESGDNPIQ